MHASPSAAFLALAVAACSAAAPERYSSGDDALASAVAQAAGPDGSGLWTYRASYVNVTIAGQSGGAPVVVVAGSHDANFPYFRTAPWDDVLLLAGGVGYGFTSRDQGSALAIDVDSGARVRLRALMRRASDGSLADVTLDLAAERIDFLPEQLGKRYDFLDVAAIPGMRWQPSQLARGAGSVVIDGTALTVSDAFGEIERGLLTGLRARQFATTYDYVAVAAAGASGFAFVDFTGHALDSRGPLGSLVDAYAQTSASDTLTIEDGALKHENTRGVARPSNDGAVLAENRVDLGLATLRRQMIRAVDADGREMHGLREVFAENAQR